MFHRVNGESRDTRGDRRKKVHIQDTHMAASSNGVTESREINEKTRVEILDFEGITLLTIEDRK